MNYVQLLRSYTRYLFFAVAHSFYSGYGQTFFLAFFIPYFREAFQVGLLEFSTLYSAATLTSAALLPFAGKKIDDMHLKTYSLRVGLFLAAAAMTAGMAPSLPVLFAAIVGLRLSAQSLMSHTASTAMARYFGHLRGKALGLSSLGHPLGEAILPLFVVQILARFGWRESWFILAGLFCLTFFPLTQMLVKRTDEFVLPPKKKSKNEANQEEGLNRRDVLTTGFFYFVIPLAIMPPFLATGFLLHQADLARLKGWDLEWMASCLVGFALFRIMGAFLIGPIIDRYSAKKLFPFHLTPLILGLVVFAAVDHSYGGFIFFSLMGFSIGLETNIKSAMWAEVYGLDHLGAIRSMALTIMIFSTGIAPILFGWLLSSGTAVGTVALWSAAAVGGTSLLSVFAPTPRKKRKT